METVNRITLDCYDQFKQTMASLEHHDGKTAISAFYKRNCPLDILKSIYNYASTHSDEQVIDMLLNSELFNLLTKWRMETQGDFYSKDAWKSFYYFFLRALVYSQGTSPLKNWIMDSKTKTEVDKKMKVIGYLFMMVLEENAITGLREIDSKVEPGLHRFLVKETSSPYISNTTLMKVASNAQSEWRPEITPIVEKRHTAKRFDTTSAMKTTRKTRKKIVF